jgi:serine-type D-Ala-D-Ala carboxypeptidase/endopeptidase
MKFSALPFLVLCILSFDTLAQQINRINNSKYPSDSLDAKIQHLMKRANVSGVAIAVFNNNKPVYNKTFGLADVQKNKALVPLLQKQCLLTLPCNLFKKK